MSDHKDTSPDRELIESVWAEARDLVKRLEGTTVQRFAVAAGDYKIEIERGSPAPVAGMTGPPPPPPPCPADPLPRARAPA